ncbi:MAG TPA: HEAT repeat domain-containing protein [Planctomycetota bacterium]|jgi:HEAT repeat protein|nr:HEAT repeat domain-containing protein [Planctomycetota bacterium]
MTPRTWSLALALALAVGRVPAQDPPQDPPQEPPPETPQDPPQDPETQEPPTPPVPLPVPEEPAPKIDVEDLAKRAATEAPEEPSIAVTWRERLARDKHITFSARSATEASAVLNVPGGIALRRAAAWMTLGLAGSPADRGRIADEARSGKGLERRAAILALGELASDATSLLGSIAADPDASVSECAMLALLRSRRPDARQRVEAIAADARDPRAAAAVALLAFDREPASDSSPRAARTRIDLRWEAARVFGGIDNKSFATQRIADLAASSGFAARVVVRAGARLPGIAPRDHLLAVLLDDSANVGNTRLAAMVDGSPRALSRLVDSELWTPKDTAEWSVILAEIEKEHAEGSCPEILAHALEIPEFAWTARALLARAGKIDVEGFGSTDFGALPPADRVLAAQTLGSIADRAAVALLGRLVDDPDPAVRGAAIVGRFRLGEASAAAALAPILDDRTRPEHAAALESLCRNVRETAVVARLEQFARRAVGPDLVTAAAALCAQNRSSGRTIVRSLLSLDAPPTGPRRLALVRALCRRPSAPDVEVLAQLFPQPGEEELNAELAVALALVSDPAVLPILRAGLWRGGFDPGVLAGMLFRTRDLVDEIAHAPTDVHPEDRRRAGFALGEWAGIEALDALAKAGCSAASPEVQGALLGVLGARTQ